MNTCEWKPIQKVHEVQGRTFVLDDEWTISCLAAPDTLQIWPRKDWKLCPYCGKPLSFGEEH